MKLAGNDRKGGASAVEAAGFTVNSFPTTATRHITAMELAAAESGTRLKRSGDPTGYRLSGTSGRR
jgi:hypothetical protein